MCILESNKYMTDWGRQDFFFFNYEMGGYKQAREEGWNHPCVGGSELETLVWTHV